MRAGRIASGGDERRVLGSDDVRRELHEVSAMRTGARQRPLGRVVHVPPVTAKAPALAPLMLSPIETAALP
jgi:hypothetical protein